MSRTQTATVTGPENAIFKPSCLNEFRNVDSNTGLTGRVTNFYPQTAPQHMLELRDTVLRADSRTLNHTAHAFKSSGAWPGAERLAEPCNRLDMMGRRDSLNGAECILEEAG